MGSGRGAVLCPWRLHSLVPGWGALASPSLWVMSGRGGMEMLQLEWWDAAMLRRGTGRGKH